MSPELANRLQQLSEEQRLLLAQTLESLPDQGADLIEADMFALIAALVEPLPREVVSCMTRIEQRRCRDLYRQLGVDVLTTDQLSEAVPWLADPNEIMRRVEAQRARAPTEYDPDG